ncbi:hypothetical protein Athai_37240 [Actinocatenispora thailandica]|uniref:Uncharacterized protein n=1 Tax=Actinocatenispora thailandica TaxID=227318 RepID=A0A7R7DR61_9ACTN|nr:hypothetical protein Athai_37240 [Actinocatenispora thailandica]
MIDVTWYGSAKPQRPEDPTTPMPASGPGGGAPGGRAGSSGHDYGPPMPQAPGDYAPASSRRSTKPRVNAARLWTGGLVSALIAAGLAIVAYLVVHGIFNLPMLGVRTDGGAVSASMAGYAVGAGVAALLATGVMHLLMLGTPRPFFYFGWIGGLCTVIAVLIPLVTTQHWDVKGATAAANLVLGIAITVLVQGTAHTAIQYPNRQPYPPAG